MARGNKKGKTFGDVLSFILMLVALGVFIYSGYTLYGYYKEYKKGTDEYAALNDAFVDNATDETEETENYDALEDEEAEPEERVSGREMKTVSWGGKDITVPTMRNPIDFEGLQAQNSDLVGWLKVRAIDISYPIMQAEDNEYYLHRTFERENNFAGCIFLNCDNSPDFSDMNSIVYGHNMKNGSMFGKIRMFKDEGVFEKSKYFWIYTKDLIFQYRIFAVTVVKNAGLTYQTFFTNEQYDELIEYAKSHSEVDGSDVEINTWDPIVTLSTCTGDSATRRVVMGKLVQTYASKR